MTHQDAADTWVALMAQTFFRTFASREFKDDPDLWPERKRKFVIAMMQDAGISKKRAIKICDHLANTPRLQMAEEMLAHPDLVLQQMVNPFWQKMGIPPPVSLCQ